MRIGYVVAGGVGRPGEGRDVPHLVERLGWLAERHDVRVVALRQGPGRWSRDGVEVVGVRGRPRRIRAAAALSRMHAERPFDVLHAFGIVPQGTVVAGVAAHLRLPGVLEAPGGEFASLHDIDFGGWRRWQGRAWILSAARRHPVAVPTAFAAAVAARRGVRTVVMPLALDPSAWPPSPPRAWRGGPLRLAWIGSLNRVKDPLAALRVVRELADVEVELEVLGEDVDGFDLAARARELGVAERVHLSGLVPPSGVRAALLRSHVLLVTSRFEGAPRTVLEAASQGVPTVGYPVGQVADWAPTAARAVPRAAGPAGLAAAVRELAAEPQRALDLARAAAERLRLHELGVAGRRWEALYDGMCSGREAGAEGRTARAGLRGGDRGAGASPPGSPPPASRTAAGRGSSAAPPEPGA